ncbi:hypothetical protein H4582DRAFT_1117723 [Lactarius indigo]|nr:hypothetical protein H4582DRAFT_1117723 [Lactarius indigo]
MCRPLTPLSTSCIEPLNYWDGKSNTPYDSRNGLTLRLLRYGLSEQKEDLKNCVVHPTDPLPVPGRYSGQVELLSFLTAALHGSRKFEQLDYDVQYSIEHFQIYEDRPLIPSTSRKRDHSVARPDFVPSGRLELRPGNATPIMEVVLSTTNSFKDGTSGW